MSFFRNLRGVIVFSGLTINTVFWFIPIVILAVVKLILPIPPVRRSITRVLMWFGENWVSLNRYILAGGGAMRWQATGTESLSGDGWYLIIANHQTWVDIPVLQIALNGRVPFLKFFIKQELIWFPFLGIAWWAMDMPFMKRYTASYLAKYPKKKGKDLEATRKACEKFKDTPTAVINFVEGTRFSEEKRQSRQSPYRHLLPPRAGGIAIALSSMGELFDAVLDVTLTYPDGIPKFWDMCCGSTVHVIADVQVRAFDDGLVGGDYQSDRAYRRDVHRWLAGIWQEKDQRLDGLRGDSQSGAPVA
jgi:1-acyl-sn-glycerol-3-phosphate acyltransferase